MRGGSAFRWDGVLRWVGVWDLPYVAEDVAALDRGVRVLKPLFSRGKGNQSILVRNWTHQSRRRERESGWASQREKVKNKTISRGGSEAPEVARNES